MTIKTWIAKKIYKLIELDKIENDIRQIRNTIYDEDAINNGYAVPKVVYKKTILWAGKRKPIK